MKAHILATLGAILFAYLTMAYVSNELDIMNSTDEAGRIGQLIFLLIASFAFNTLAALINKQTKKDETK